jgi:hypothetical protein
MPGWIWIFLKKEVIFPPGEKQKIEIIGAVC